MTTTGAKILILGSGAREHALTLALLQDGTPHNIIVAPGNAGIATTCSTVGSVATLALNDCDPALVSEFAQREQVDLVVIGPEAPLVAGVADALRRRRIPVFGPNRAAAALEGSKTFAKRIMETAGVPTGRAQLATSLDAVALALHVFGAPYVVKADGLAAGKGVLVTHDMDAALTHARFYLQRGPVLVEEFLDGPEVSLFFLSDGTTVLPLSPAQDYKRLRDGDEGPNTGGMGAYSPLPWLAHAATGRGDTFGSEAAFVEEVTATIALPTVRQLAAEGTPFVGLLYAGLILTRTGVKVIEFNARFGDPETQVVLPRLAGSLYRLLFAAATGELAGEAKPQFRDEAVISVVLASEGYPEAPITGRPITGLRDASNTPGVQILHAATARNTASSGASMTALGESDDVALLATGGRVLNVVARGSSFAGASERAYTALGHIHLAGGQYRRDIAERTQ
ncbi:MAG: phosphoribosylamine--glycine ligase [Candidatus Lumbricidophila eiseniae]|uniref:Phosphoribosylamine--glycine ligase n=1 Tax=Candidatus Lumbricidiphila eiseniae TaxID=1969409 RepID=A0A2A6FP57_9MICO|nr:MAG: phosphoribosylamine--glycine ligase [Candidatus Lumbricidophila eiseniae]